MSLKFNPYSTNQTEYAKLNKGSPSTGVRPSVLQCTCVFKEAQLGSLFGKSWCFFKKQNYTNSLIE